MSDEIEPAGQIDALLARIREGDQTALTPLLEVLYPVLKRRARRFTTSADGPYTDPSELVSDLMASQPFLDALSGKHKLNPKYLASEKVFIGYCAALLRQLVERARLDSNQNVPIELSRADDFFASRNDGEAPENSVEREELRSAFERLTSREKNLFLWRSKGKSISEIATTLGLTTERIRQSLSRIEKRLRNSLTSPEPSAPPPAAEPLIDVKLLQRMPLPLAQLYRRMYSAETPSDTTNAAFALFEAGLKLLCFTAILEYANRNNPDPFLLLRLTPLSRPTLGDWLELARLFLPLLSKEDSGFAGVERFVLGEPLDDCPTLARLSAVLEPQTSEGSPSRSSVRIRSLFEQLLMYRNKIAHGPRAEQSDERVTRALKAGLTELFSMMDVLAGRQLIYFGVGPYAVVPLHIENLVALTPDPAAVPEQNRVYLTGPDGSLRLLHPLVTYDPETENCYLFKNRTGREQLELVCHTNGLTQIVKANDRREFLRRVFELPQPQSDVEPSSPSEAPRIYISYRNSDSLDTVRKLFTDLTREFGREAVFRDKSRLTDGPDWGAELERNAKTCPVMLVVIGQTWQSDSDMDGDFAIMPRLWKQGDWVRKEIALALDAENVVIPVLVERGLLPARSWLSNCGLERLADRQTLQLRQKEYDTDLAQLIEVLRKLLPEIQSPSPPPAVHRRLYLSAEMREFRTLRQQLYSELRRPNLSVTGQEEFVAYAKSVLEVIDDYIRHCDVVIHFVGYAAGVTPRPEDVATLLAKYPNLPTKLAVLDDKTSWNPGFTYIQWEAYLGLYHNKEVLVYRIQPEALREVSTDIPEEEWQSRTGHLDRLAKLGCEINTLSSLDRLSERLLRDLDVVASPPAATLTGDEIVATFPTPIAAAYWWHQNVREDNFTPEMAEHALDRVVEVAVRYAALIAMVDLIQCVSAANLQAPVLPPSVTKVLTARGPHPVARWGETLVECVRALRQHPGRFCNDLPSPFGARDNSQQFPPLAEYLNWRQEFDREVAALTGTPARFEADVRLEREGGERVHALLVGLSFVNYPLAFAHATSEPPRVLQLYSCLGVELSTTETTYPLFASEGFRPEVPFLLCRRTNRVLYLDRLFVGSAAQGSRASGRVFLFQCVRDDNVGQFAEYESVARRELRSVRQRLEHTGLNWVWNVDPYQRLISLTPEQLDDLRHFPPTGDLVGRIFGGYRLYAKVGEGGSGVVYAAESLAGERVAVKVGNFHHEQLEHEAKLLAGVPPHTGLVQVFGHGTEGTPAGQLDWFAMEYAPGGTLDDHNRLTPRVYGWADPNARRQTVAAFTAVAEAVAHLHAHGIVHRDVAPPNVVRMADGSLKLIDFGRSTPLEPIGRHNREVITTTPVEYQAPEVASPRYEVSPRQDVYQLGVLLLDLAVGPLKISPRTTPRWAESTASLGEEIALAPPPLREFISRCLAERPEDRPADASEMLSLFRLEVLAVVETPPVIRIEPTPEAVNPFADDAPGATYFDTDLRLQKVMGQLEDFDALWLYGPGGSGKTAMVREILRRAVYSREFERVVYVDVAHLRNEGQHAILSRIHHAITDSEDLVPRMADVAAGLRVRRIFLALDGCDSLLTSDEENEPGKPTDVIFTLLRACCDYDDARGVHLPAKSRFLIVSRAQPYSSKLRLEELDYLLKWKVFDITSPTHGIALHDADRYLDVRLAESPVRFTNKEKAGLIADATGSFDTLRRLAFDLYERKRRERSAAVRWYASLALLPAQEVAVGQLVTAEVRFHPAAVDDAHPTHPPDAQPLDIPDGVLELTAFLDAPGFSLASGGHTATVPMIGLRPQRDTLAFRLIAIGSGKSSVRISVYPGGQSVGGVPVELSAEANVSAPLAVADIPLLPDVPSPKPNLTLGVWVSERPDGRWLVCRLHRSGQPDEPTAELSLTVADAAAMRAAAALAGREAVALGGPDGTALLRRLGADLLHRLLPADGPLFQQFQLAFNAAIVAPPQSLLVISDPAAVLPWELLCVSWELEGKRDYRFVGEVFAIAHWLDRRGLPLFSEVPVDEVELVLTSADPVAGAVWADDLGGEVRVENRLDQLAVVQPGPYHGLHVLRDDPPRPGGEITAANRVSSDEPIVARRRLDFSLKRPVVGRSVTDRSGLVEADTHPEAGWTWAFLSAGASAVVASRWPLPAGAEAVATRRVYSGLRAGEPLGEAVWKARQAVRMACPEHPGWLAPSLFGHPLAAPYRVESADGFTFLEALDPPPEKLFRPGGRYLFRASYRAEAPAWYDGPRRLTNEDRVDGEEVTVAVLPMTGGQTLREPLRSGGGRVWLCDLILTIPAANAELVIDDDGKRTWPLVVRFNRGRKELHTAYLDLDVGGGP